MTPCNSYCASMWLGDLKHSVLSTTNLGHCCSHQLHVGLTRYQFATAATPVAPLYSRVHSSPWCAWTGSTRESAPCVATLIISRGGDGTGGYSRSGSPPHLLNRKFWIALCVLLRGPRVDEFQLPTAIYSSWYILGCVFLSFLAHVSSCLYDTVAQMSPHRQIR